MAMAHNFASQQDIEKEVRKEVDEAIAEAKESPMPDSSDLFKDIYIKGLGVEGSAKRLVKTALQEAAKKREMRYSDLKKIERGVCRHFHDDITIIVVFLDSNLISKASSARGSNFVPQRGRDQLLSQNLSSFRNLHVNHDSP